ncbi:MAG: putative metal-binding motif-containing protein, partial [Myxococcota bacterium]
MIEWSVWQSAATLDCEFCPGWSGALGAIVAGDEEGQMVWVGWGLMACGLFGLFERDPSRVDADRDGAPASIDCDDDDPARAPGLPEICDGIDNDCDGLVDGDDTDSPPVGLATFFADRDADGFGDPAIPAFSCTRPPG